MENKENIKIALLGIIAFFMAVNTYMTMNTDNPSPTPVQASVAPISNDVPQPIKIDPPTKDPVIINNTPKPLQPDVPSGPVTSMSFAEPAFNFGEVPQDSENTHKFSFTNTGTEPLIISNAKGSCGCTVPTYPKEPIAPGATSEITVVYKPGKQSGNQTKTVTITANTEPRDTRIQFSAVVNPI